MTGGKDRLDEMMREQGFIRSGGHDDGLEDPAAVDARIVVGDLPADTRADDIVCALCVRTVHRRRRAELRPGVVGCRLCASLDQEPGTVDAWLRLSRERRRTYLAINYGLDPATREATEVSAEWTEFYDETVTVMPRPVGVLREMVPNNFFEVLVRHGLAT